MVDIETSSSGSKPNSKLLEPSSPTLTDKEKGSAVSQAQSTSLQQHHEIHESNAKILTTPAVRKIAKESGIDLSKVQGSGPGGRILKEDVLRVRGGPFVPKRADHPLPTVPHAAAPPGPLATTSVHAPTPTSSSPVHGRAPADLKVPIRGVQRLMVASMNAANQVRLLSKLHCA